MDNNIALKVIELTKQFSDNIVVFNNLNFTFYKGDFIGLIGPNGKGKSTFIKIITTLTKKTSGKIYIYGLDLDTNKNEIKKLIGYVPQEFNFSIAEPVWQILLDQGGYHGLCSSKTKELTEYYLKKVNLWDKRYTKAGKLSGGMKRRLMIVRALITTPKLLVLDEPTTGIDKQNRIIIWNILKQLNSEGTTIILVSHFSDEIEKLCRTYLSFNNNQSIITLNKIYEI